MGLKPLVPRHVSEIKTLRLWDRREEKEETQIREKQVSAQIRVMGLTRSRS